MAGEKNRDFALDAIRATSIIYVVGFWHINNYDTALTWYHQPLFYRLAVLALGSFVFISGFLAARSMRTFESGAAVKYYRRRLLRIYPPYLAALLGFAVCGLMSMKALFTGAALVSMLLPPAPPTLWFITMIMLFYLIVPALKYWPRHWLLMSCIAALAWIDVLLFHTLIRPVDPRILIYFPTFLAGMIFARLRRFPSIVWPLSLAIAGFILSWRVHGAFADMSLWMAPWALFGAVSIFQLTSGKLPYSAIIEKVSYGSYFFYLFHRVIFKAIVDLPHETVVTRTILLYFVGLPMALMVAVFGQRVYDNVADRLISRANRQMPILTPEEADGAGRLLGV